MSSFTSVPHFRPATVDELKNGDTSAIIITKGFQWDLGIKGSRDNIKIRKGTYSNAASFPWWAKSILRLDPYDARWIKEVILHDELYRTHYSECKVLCDAIMFHALKVSDRCPTRLRWLFFISLLVGGQKVWDACESSES